MTIFSVDFLLRWINPDGFICISMELQKDSHTLARRQGDSLYSLNWGQFTLDLPSKRVFFTLVYLFLKTWNNSPRSINKVFLILIWSDKGALSPSLSCFNLIMCTCCSHTLNKSNKNCKDSYAKHDLLLVLMLKHSTTNLLLSYLYLSITF